MVLACGDLPPASISRDTLLDALRTFWWLPSADEIDALVRAATADLRRTRSGLRLIVRQAPFAPPAPSDDAVGPSPTDEARDRIIEVFRPRFAAAMAAARSPSEQISAPRRPKAGYLTGEHLAAAAKPASGISPSGAGPLRPMSEQSHAPRKPERRM